MQFTIDDKLWSLDDPRIDKMHAGDMSVASFVRASKSADPWQIVVRHGTDKVPEMHITAFDEAGIVELESKRESNMRQMISRTGGITGKVIYENREVFLQVYPELADKMKEVVDIVTKQRCKGCALNSRTRPLMEALLALPSIPSRPYEKLAKIIPEQGLERLRTGTNLPEGTIKIAPNRAAKKSIPLRTTPLVGEPKATWLLPGEKDPNIIRHERQEKAETKRRTSARSPRPGCFDCCRKHLAQAVVLLGESLQGYPEHRWLAVGHMAEAAEEILEKSEELAAEIRAERLAVMEDPSYIPTLMRLFPTIDEMAEAEKLGIN